MQGAGTGSFPLACPPCRHQDLMSWTQGFLAVATFLSDTEGQFVQNFRNNKKAAFAIFSSEYTWPVMYKKTKIWIKRTLSNVKLETVALLTN